MEFVIKTDLSMLPKTIDSNFESIKEYLQERLECYNNLVVTEDDLQSAKKDKANLNTLKSAIDGKRKEVKKTCLAPYEIFEKQCKELIAMIDEPINAINTQLKVFDDKRKSEKYQILLEYFNSIAGDLIEFIRFDDILNPKWGNVSIKLLTLQSEISETVERICRDLDTLQSQLVDKPYKSAVIAKYNESYDLGNALQYATYLQQEAEKQERLLQQKQIIESEPETQKTSSLPIEKVAEEPLYTGVFRVTCTRNQLIQLREFMKQIGIQFEAIKNNGGN